jgi:hypothetical protein
MSTREDIAREHDLEDFDMFDTPLLDGLRADATSLPKSNFGGFDEVDVALSPSVIRILDNSVHIEMNKDTFPCLEATNAATTVVNMASSHPVTHDDTIVCAEEIAGAIIVIASDVASLDPVTRIIDNNPSLSH